MISLQDYHILEGKYKDLVREHANLGATMFIKDKMLKELDDTITQLQQELDKYKLIFKGKPYIHAIEGSFQHPDFENAFARIANMEECEIYIKEIGKDNQWN